MSRPTNIQSQNNNNNKVRYQLIVSQLQMVNQTLFNESFVIVKNIKTGKTWQSPKFYFKMFEVWQIQVDGPNLLFQLFMKIKSSHPKISETQLRQGSDIIYLQQIQNPKNKFCVLRYELKEYTEPLKLKKSNHFLDASNIFDSFNEVSRVQPQQKKPVKSTLQDQKVGFHGDISIISSQQNDTQSKNKQQMDPLIKTQPINNQNKVKVNDKQHSYDDDQKKRFANFNDSTSFIEQFLRIFPDNQTEKPPTTPINFNQMEEKNQGLSKIKQNIDESEEQYITTAQKWYTQKFNKKNQKTRKRNSTLPKKIGPEPDSNPKNIKINQFNTSELLQNEAIIKQITDISVQQNIRLKTIEFSLTTDGGQTKKLYQVSRNDGNSSSLWYTAISLPNDGTYLVQCLTDQGELNGCLGSTELKKGQCVLFDNQGNSVCNFAFKCKSICNYIVQTQQLLAQGNLQQNQQLQNKGQPINKKLFQNQQLPKQLQNCQKKNQLLSPQQNKKQNLTILQKEIHFQNGKQDKIANENQQKILSQNQNDQQQNLTKEEFNNKNNSQNKTSRSQSYPNGIQQHENENKQQINLLISGPKQDKKNSQQQLKYDLQKGQKYGKQFISQASIKGTLVTNQSLAYYNNQVDIQKNKQKQSKIIPQNKQIKQIISDKDDQQMTKQQVKFNRPNEINQNNNQRLFAFKQNAKRKQSNLSSRLKKFSEIDVDEAEKQHYENSSPLSKKNIQSLRLNNSNNNHSTHNDQTNFINSFQFQAHDGNNAQSIEESPKRERFSSVRYDTYDKQKSFRFQRMLTDEVSFQNLHQSKFTNGALDKNRMDFKIQSVMLKLNAISYNSKIIKMQIENYQYFTETSKGLYVSKWEGKGYFFPNITKFAILHIYLIQQNQATQIDAGKCAVHLSLLPVDKSNQSLYCEEYMRNQNLQQIGKVFINYKIINKNLKKIESKNSTENRRTIIQKIRKYDYPNIQSQLTNQIRSNRKKTARNSTQGSSRSIDLSSALAYRKNHRSNLKNNNYDASQSVLSRYRRPPLSKRKYQGGNILIPKASRFVQPKINNIKKQEPGPGSYEMNSMFDRHATPL